MLLPQSAKFIYFFTPYGWTIITPRCYMTSLDLKDAHYSITIAPEQQHFWSFMETHLL